MSLDLLLDDKKAVCCICLENENYYACWPCDFCQDGFICCECSMEYEDNNDPFYLRCPICRSILISKNKHSIIISGLFDNIGISCEQIKTPLFIKWLQTRQT